MTSRVLILLRHAKSSWTDPALDDHDRPLAPRGRRAAALIGEHLRATDLWPDLVVCSSAVRARQTLELVAPAGRIEIDGAVYDASAAQLLERVHCIGDEIGAAMLVGHNPGLQDLAAELAPGAPQLAAEKFPTGALATLTFSGRWRELQPGRAELVALVKPRELG